MTPEKDWYRTWFNSPYYHILYKNRNYEEAHHFIDNLFNYLKPKPNAAILDLACGKGRHSQYLCRKGFEVTGIDLSEENIKAARQTDCRGLYFHVHDMREPYKKDRFDYVFNFFTSFGYFDNELDNLKTAKAISYGLKPNGICTIDFLNAQVVINNLPGIEVITREGIDFHIERTYDSGFIIKHINFEAGGKAHTYFEKVQALCLPDFERLFDAAGLQITGTFGGYQLQPYDPENSERLIIMGKNAA